MSSRTSLAVGVTVTAAVIALLIVPAVASRLKKGARRGPVRLGHAHGHTYHHHDDDGWGGFDGLDDVD